MKRLVVFPSDPIESYLKVGKSYEYLEGYYNPNNYFDEVYCVSLYGKSKRIGKMHYVSCKAEEIHDLILHIKPDVIRAYGGYISSDLAQLSKVDNIPIIVSVHDTNPDLIYESLKYADYIICMADCVKEIVIKLTGFDEKNIWVMPNRVDTKLFKFKYDELFFDKLNKRFGDGKHILHVGRKVKQKNLDTLIKCIKYLPTDVSVIFVGRGNDEEYRQLAIDDGVEDRCFWVDSVKREELPLWYSWCDCFCTPSRWEGFGFVFIEAAACQAAIVTSNIAPMNEYLTDCKDAILVDDYENPKKIADAISYCFNNLKEVKDMKKRARDIGLRFDKYKIDDMEVAIYKEVIRKGTRNRIDNEMLKHKLLRKYKEKNILWRGVNKLLSKIKKLYRIDK